MLYTENILYFRNSLLHKMLLDYWINFTYPAIHLYSNVLLIRLIHLFCMDWSLHFDWKPMKHFSTKIKDSYDYHKNFVLCMKNFVG